MSLKYTYKRFVRYCIGETRSQLNRMIPVNRDEYVTISDNEKYVQK